MKISGFFSKFTNTYASRFT